MKFVNDRPFADPDAAARKLVEIANAAEAVQDGRLYIELINGAFLNAGGSPAEYRAGIERAIAKGWLWRHEVRPLFEVHPGRRRAVRLMAATGWKQPFDEPISWLNLVPNLTRAVSIKLNNGL